LWRWHNRQRRQCLFPHLEAQILAHRARQPGGRDARLYPIKQRFDGGTASALDTARQESLSTPSAPRSRRWRRFWQNATLALLIGRPPGPWHSGRQHVALAFRL
jgi:hypothetical protein